MLNDFVLWGSLGLLLIFVSFFLWKRDRRCVEDRKLLEYWKKKAEDCRGSKRAQDKTIEVLLKKMDELLYHIEKKNRGS